MQAFLSFFKLTRSGSKMFQSTKAKVSCNSLFTSVTYEHTSSAPPTTHLQSIGAGRRPREPGRADQIPSGLRHPRTRGLGAGHLEQRSREHPHSYHASPSPEENPDVIAWLGAGTIHLETKNSQGGAFGTRHPPPPPAPPVWTPHSSVFPVVLPPAVASSKGRGLGHPHS
jgi:hypothetical protein